MSKLSKGGLGTLIEGMVKLPQDGYSITIKFANDYPECPDYSLKVVRMSQEGKELITVFEDDNFETPWEAAAKAYEVILKTHNKVAQA